MSITTLEVGSKLELRRSVTYYDPNSYDVMVIPEGSPVTIEKIIAIVSTDTLLIAVRHDPDKPPVLLSYKLDPGLVEFSLSSTLI